MRDNERPSEHEHRARPSRRALVAGTVVVSLVLVLLLLGATEVVLRMTRSEPTEGSLVLSERLGWDRWPGVERPIPASAPTEPGKEPLRILFMGDSFTHNTAWSRLTIEALNEMGVPATGWEAGVSGYGQVQESMKLESLLPEMKPDIVVLLFYGWNDPRDNFAMPGIVYNPDMLDRPFIEADGSITPPNIAAMRLRQAELFRRTALEGWWFGRHLKASRRAMRDGGADAPAAAGRRLLTIYSDPLTWMPLYMPSMQEGAYMRGAWQATAKAFARVKQVCQDSHCTLIVVGIDAPFTIDHDVFKAHIATDPRFRAEDFDPGLPLRRFAEVVRSMGLEPVLPARALAEYAAKVGRKIYDPPDGNLTGHLLPDAQEVLALEVAKSIAASVAR